MICPDTMGDTPPVEPGDEPSLAEEPSFQQQAEVVKEEEEDSKEIRDDQELADALGGVDVYDQECLEQKVSKEIADHERQQKEASLVKDRDQLEARIKEVNEHLGECRAQLDALCRCII